MDERSAFAGRALLRVLRTHGADLPAAFSRLRDTLSGDLLAACARLQQEFEKTTKPTGDLEQDGLRVAIRSIQLVRENDGQFTADVWSELERTPPKVAELSSGLVQGLLGTLFASSATAMIGLVVATIYVIFVLPQFESLFASLGARLPSLTAAVLGAGRWPLLIAALLLVAGAIMAFPLRPQWARGKRTWRLDLFTRRAWLGRALANDYRRLLFVQYAATLVAAGIHPRKSLAAASREADIYTRLDFEGSDPATVTEPLPAQLMSADRLGQLREELVAQRGLHAEAMAESAARLQMQTALVMRVILYLLIATLVVAMYLPIFMLGSAI